MSKQSCQHVGGGGPSWEKFRAPLQIGDLVRCEYGLGVIDGVGRNLEDSQYSLEMLPGAMRKLLPCGVITGPKCAWYELGELELVEAGPLHKMRDEWVASGLDC